MSDAPFTLENVGRRLKIIRRAFNLSQAQLADLCEVKAQAVGNWEQGRQRPGIEAMEKMVDHLTLTTDYLFLGRIGSLRHDIATAVLDAERTFDRAANDNAA